MRNLTIFILLLMLSCTNNPAANHKKLAKELEDIAAADQKHRAEIQKLELTQTVKKHITPFEYHSKRLPLVIIENSVR